MNKDGVTILQIVITVVIMIIIASVAILYGSGMSSEANIASIYVEIKEIEDAVREIKVLRQYQQEEDAVVFYDEVSAPKVSQSEYATILPSNGSTFYYLDFTSSRTLENALELENVRHDYLLDFENGNIYLVKGVAIPSSTGGTPVITYDSDVIESYYNSTFSK